MSQADSYWTIVWKQFRQHTLGFFSLCLIAVLAFLAIYAPFLASSKPIAVQWNGSWYFPLFRYLFYTGFYTKRIDLFYNILMFTLPLMWICWKFVPYRKVALFGVFIAHLTLFVFFGWFYSKDPASDPALAYKKHKMVSLALEKSRQGPLAVLPLFPSWKTTLQHTNTYSQLMQVIEYRQKFQHHHKLQEQSAGYEELALDRWAKRAARKERKELLTKGVEQKEIASQQVLAQKALASLSEREKQQIAELPTLWKRKRDNQKEEIQRNQEEIDFLHDRYQVASRALLPLLEQCQREPKLCNPDLLPSSMRKKISEWRRILIQYEMAKSENQYISDRMQWLQEQQKGLGWVVMPLFRSFHWEDDAGGEQSTNRFLPWYERSRTNAKDLLAALLFGIRISLVVGVLATSLALLIGIPIGAVAGYIGGRFDIIVSRMLEVWESMPTFFMLLLVVAVTQSKSIFLVIAVIGFFGWTGFARYMRAEVLKQRNLSYVEACRALGLPNRRILFSHILPNAIPPILTLLPFAIMGAITSEAGLSFLGLGEEGSCSWGVLMDEGRQAFPGESYLLWPPAILLTLLLVSIALVGDALRDSLDPKLKI